jgi:hypothetical protein
MKSWRITILGMMGIVLACGVAFYWLMRPTFHAASLAFTAALTILLVALLELRYGRLRTFWFGFVVFGWGYLLLAMAPGAWSEVRPYLITSHLLGDLADVLGHTNPSTLIVRRLDYGRVPPDSKVNLWFHTDEGNQFQRVGHSLAAILHGVAGGLLAVFLSRRSRGVGSAIADHPKSKAVSEDGPH